VSTDRAPDIAGADGEDPARVAMRDGNWNEAARIWGERALKRPDRISSHRHYVRALIRLKRYSQAVAACDIALRRHPDEVEFIYRRLWLLDRLQMDDALTREVARGRVQKAANSSGPIALIAGRHCWQRGDLEPARCYFSVAETHDETRDRAIVYLARLEYRTGDLESAERRWRAVADDQSMPARPEEPSLFLGRIALKRGDVDVAIQHFDRAVDIEPSAKLKVQEWMPDPAVTPIEEPELDPLPLPEETRPVDGELPQAEPVAAAETPEEVALPDLPEPEPEPKQELDAPTLIEAYDSDQWDSQLDQARELLDGNRLEEALDLALPVMAADPDNIRACEIAGFASNRLSRWKDAHAPVGGWPIYSPAVPVPCSRPPPPMTSCATMRAP